jgi:WD40 repeat protein
MVDGTGIGLSTSYDASLLVWDLASKTCVQSLFKGHKDAITTFEWHNSLVVSAARNGTLAFWDINTGKAFKKANSHEGAVSKVKMYDDGVDSNIILSAGLNDGVL